MTSPSVVIELFSRKRLDRDVAAAALAFLLDYGNGVFQLRECGVYPPYQPFDRSELDLYIRWMTTEGGEFGFRGQAPPFSVEGHIANLLFPEILRAYENSPAKSLPSVPPPAFCTRWRLRFEPRPQTSSDIEFLRKCFIDARRAANADYGFAADAADQRSKNFQSTLEKNSEVQQYVGDDPERGIPGLYWLNYFGPIYTRFFGQEKMASLAAHMAMPAPPDSAFLLQFGQGPEDSLSATVQQRQKRAIQILGEEKFFDIRRPNRVLSVPPELSRKS